MNFGVFVCVVGSLDPSKNDPTSAPLFTLVQMGIPLQILVYEVLLIVSLV
jgi:hypothetical protein